jgi:hypothetical protein
MDYDTASSNTHLLLRLLATGFCGAPNAEGVAKASLTIAPNANNRSQGIARHGKPSLVSAGSHRNQPQLLSTGAATPAHHHTAAAVARILERCQYRLTSVGPT